MDTEWADLRGRTSYSPERFTEAVYQLVAGKPRLAGALAALEYFGEELPATPARCFVVEDAAVGVQSAKAGGMAALGVSRPALAEGRLARKTEG